MRKTILILAAAFSLIAVSCQKWETPSTPDSVSILTMAETGGEAQQGGTKAVTIAATSDWTAISDKGWLYVTPSSGSKGIKEVVIHFNENTTGQSRTGKITFTCGDYSEVYTLVQKR